MEGQGGEKEGGAKKGMPYSGSNSREQVKTDMVLIADIFVLRRKMSKLKIFSLTI